MCLKNDYFFKFVIICIEESFKFFQVFKSKQYDFL